jgi:prepilin-type N-terminal cleavage/methylation domain-containing protein
VQRKQHKAFSLIELLVVIATIAVLIGILIAGMQGIKAERQDLICKVNLQQLAISTQDYAMAYESMPIADYYPTKDQRDSWESTEEIWFCPVEATKPNPRPYGYSPARMIDGLTTSNNISIEQAAHNVYLGFDSGKYSKLFVDVASLHRTRQRTSLPFAFNAVWWDAQVRPMRQGD